MGDVAQQPGAIARQQVVPTVVGCSTTTGSYRPVDLIRIGTVDRGQQGTVSGVLHEKPLACTLTPLPSDQDLVGDRQPTELVDLGTGPAIPSTRLEKLGVILGVHASSRQYYSFEKIRTKLL